MHVPLKWRENLLCPAPNGSGDTEMYYHLYGALMYHSSAKHWTSAVFHYEDTNWYSSVSSLSIGHRCIRPISLTTDKYRLFAPMSEKLATDKVRFYKSLATGALGLRDVFTKIFLLYVLSIYSEECSLPGSGCIKLCAIWKP